MQSRYGLMKRWLVRVFMGLAFLVLTLYGLTDPVAAKGPQSATITGPGIDRPIELIEGNIKSNTELVTLFMEQTGLWYGTGDLPRLLEEPPGELGPGYTLTWINSGPPDMSIEERTIRQFIYLEAENGPIIHTPEQETLQNWGPEVTGWFAAPNGLKDTLAELGAPVSEATAFDKATLNGTVPETAPLDEGPAGSLWILGIAGLALVAGLAGAFGFAAKQ